MSDAAKFREADIKRAASGVIRAGIPIARIEIDHTGKIVIIPGLPTTAKESGEWADLEQ
ncbi:hypothetical protein UFOVP5_30 [uncultured Caudovirales phage]|uniref:Uncharacterized protein n=1 Tax=uncultured Caudovirales phage TaxID=2100421 RepID=A0A6J5KHB3_9CAUD|nr:hypothetical protein UFOVP5_30 [uncultured Caudovirales phage]